MAIKIVSPPACSVSLPDILRVISQEEAWTPNCRPLTRSCGGTRGEWQDGPVQPPKNKCLNRRHRLRSGTARKRKQAFAMHAKIFITNGSWHWTIQRTEDKWFCNYVCVSLHSRTVANRLILICNLHGKIQIPICNTHGNNASSVKA